MICVTESNLLFVVRCLISFIPPMPRRFSKIVLFPSIFYGNVADMKLARSEIKALELLSEPRGEDIGMFMYRFHTSKMITFSRISSVQTSLGLKL